MHKKICNESLDENTINDNEKMCKMSRQDLNELDDALFNDDLNFIEKLKI